MENVIEGKKSICHYKIFVRLKNVKLLATIWNMESSNCMGRCGAICYQIKLCIYGKL